MTIEQDGELKLDLSAADRSEFLAQFGGIYEHSQWVAESVYDAENSDEKLVSISSLKEAMKQVVNDSSDEQKLALLRAHPDLAGKAALAGELTEDSTAEQAGAGLDQCSEAELQRFHSLNNAYKEKFGFPFIMAVKGATKEQILEGFENRMPNDRQTEFDTAIQQVHKIAGFRLEAFCNC